MVCFEYDVLYRESHCAGNNFLRSRPVTVTGAALQSTHRGLTCKAKEQSQVFWRIAIASHVIEHDLLEKMNIILP